MRALGICRVILGEMTLGFTKVESDDASFALRSHFVDLGAETVAFGSVPVSMNLT